MTKLTSYPTNSNRIISILGGLCLFLSLIEYIIPKPIPFIKLGIANIPILISIVILPKKDILKLILIKSIGGSLVSGNLFSWIFLYSLSGSLISGISMILISILLNNKVSMIGISLIGSLTSNLTQILLATAILGPGAKYLGVPILIIGFISGTFIGVLTNNFLNKSVWIRNFNK
ncbi:MAG: Gx transporter family protein [Spirochaetales bacterium]|nr:Gx transporter family protein [Spirochaetales bacterium]